MRLLPDQQLPTERAAGAVGRGHLRPAPALYPCLRALSIAAGRIVSYQGRLRSNSAVRFTWGSAPRATSAFPGGISVPAIACEPGFLRGQGTRALNRGEILREHDAALQLAGAFVRAAAQVDAAPSDQNAAQCFADGAGAGSPPAAG